MSEEFVQNEIELTPSSIDKSIDSEYGDFEINSEDLNISDLVNEVNPQGFYEGRDLKGIAEYYDIESPEGVESLEKYIGTVMEKKGYTRQEALLHLEASAEVAAEYEQEPTKEMTLPERKKFLHENLTTREKANYKAIATHLEKNMGELGLTKQDINDVLLNPYAVKIFNSLMSGAKGGVTTREIKAPESKLSISGDVAISQVQKRIQSTGNRDSVIKYAKDLAEKVKSTDVDQYNQLIKRIFNL